MNTRVRVQAIPAITAAAFGLSPLGRLLAQGAPVPVIGLLQPTGFDEINLTIEDAGIVGMPETPAAGRYLFTFHKPLSGEQGDYGFIVVQFPEGVTAEQAYADEQEAMYSGTFPSWCGDARFAGGARIGDADNTWAILDLTPGTWHVSDLMVTAPAVLFEVTGDFPENVLEPEANVELHLVDLDFEIASGAFIAGENLVTSHNTGDQNHHVVAFRVPDGTTEGQVHALFNSMMTGTPEPNMLDDSSMEYIFNSIDQSLGTSISFPVTLDAGTYLFVCWIPDSATGIPHVMTGMHELIVIE